jgi:hypothetical protein
MGSEMQPQIMRAQKSEQILIFEINRLLTCFQISKHYFQWFGFINVIGSSIADTQLIFFYSFFVVQHISKNKNQENDLIWLFFQFLKKGHTALKSVGSYSFIAAILFLLAALWVFAVS